jgi:hypothetical protein
VAVVEVQVADHLTVKDIHQEQVVQVVVEQEHQIVQQMVEPQQQTLVVAVAVETILTLLEVMVVLV